MFCAVEIAPSPNAQRHPTMGLSPAVDVSVKYTVRGMQQLVGAAVNSATGRAFAVM
jgi:hypothetical protein